MRFKALAEWLAWQETLHPRSIDLGLSRVRRVFERLAPGRRPVFTITVGGTNGKGSCVAMLDAILRAAGYRVGAYTSPHILRYNERICIDGRPVDDGPICDAFARIDRARGDTSLSFFEFGTLAALELFSAADLDVQILEVGLGGRLDAVNLVDADAALIASIDLDHEDWLGRTRAAIGLEKAGIFRPGRPAVAGDPDLPATVVRYAEQHQIPLRRLGHDFGFEPGDGTWTWWGGDIRWEDLPLPAIPGQHQLMNAAAVLETLRQVAPWRPVTAAAIRDGLRRVRLPGRFQLFPGEVPVLVDVAHNPAAVNVLAKHLRQRFPGRRVHAVFAIMRDKDVAGVLDNIRDMVDRWYLAPLQMARAATPAELREIFRARGIVAVEHQCADVRAAYAKARQNAAAGDLILVFGSFFLVSDYLAQCTQGEVGVPWTSS